MSHLWIIYSGSANYISNTLLGETRRGAGNKQRRNFLEPPPQIQPRLPLSLQRPACHCKQEKVESWKTCLCYGFTLFLSGLQNTAYISLHYIQELSIIKSNMPVCIWCGCLVNTIVSESDLFISTSLSLCCSSERYVVLDHAHRSLVQVQPFREDTAVPSLEHCFCLTLLENHQGRQMERVMKAPTQYVEL